mmetsp:Transcript_131732/g.185859  ORF Transcript_131732/g.185859 Transcript_131732/m.185859 type:complete len:82 (-) Transcript_131732:36-281(-)
MPRIPTPYVDDLPLRSNATDGLQKHDRDLAFDEDVLGSHNRWFVMCLSRRVWIKPPPSLLVPNAPPATRACLRLDAMQGMQ